MLKIKLIIEIKKFPSINAYYVKNIYIKKHYTKNKLIIHIRLHFLH